MGRKSRVRNCNSFPALFRRVARPAEVVERLAGAGQREANNVEIIAFDARNETAGLALDRVSSGLVVRFAGSEIARDVLSAQFDKMNQSGFHEAAPFRVGKANERDSCKD